MDACFQRFCSTDDAWTCLLLWWNGQCKKHHINNATELCSARRYNYCMDFRWFYPDNFLQWADKMQDKDPMGDISEFDFLVMVNMTSMMLRGLGEMLQQPRNTADTWAPFARRALQEKNMLQEVEDEIASWTKDID